MLKKTLQKTVIEVWTILLGYYCKNLYRNANHMILRKAEKIYATFTLDLSAM